LEGRLIRLLRELKVPGVILFIMVTVWSVGHAQQLDHLARTYRLPAPSVLRVKHVESDAPGVSGERIDVAAADPTDD
jgi:hypothetical protein